MKPNRWEPLARVMGLGVDHWCRIFLTLSLLMVACAVVLLCSLTILLRGKGLSHVERLRYELASYVSNHRDAGLTEYMQPVIGSISCGEDCSDLPLFSSYTANSPDFVEKIRRMVAAVNTNNSNLWKAKYNDFVSPLPPELFRQRKEPYASILLNYYMLDELLDGTRQRLAQLQQSIDNPLPERFDAREKWPHCHSIGHVVDQAGCGSCWAFALTQVMSDRLCIRTNGKRTEQASAQDLLECNREHKGCQGVDTLMVGIKHWVQDGIVTGGDFGSYQGCKPYKYPAVCGSPCIVPHYIFNGRHPTVCKRKCWDRREYEVSKIKGNTTYILSRSKPLMTLHIVNEMIKNQSDHDGWRADLDGKLDRAMLDLVDEAIRRQPYDYPDHRFLAKHSTTLIEKELMERGPVATCFDITEDFQVYEKGIYHPVVGERMYGHCIRIIGWGVDNGVSYWLVSNTWGPEWGENGFFRIQQDNLPDSFIEDVFGVWPDP